jgi:CheY-like chemotaxis protein
MNEKILIIEDDPFTLSLLEEGLKMENFQTDTATCGKEALEKIEEIKNKNREKPDLVLLDILLPDINGVEILKEIKKNPETKDIKVFAFTNFSDSELNQKLIQEGVDKILLKSDVSLDQLSEIIREDLKKNGKIECFF